MIFAGGLRHSAAIQGKGTGTDSYGVISGEWTTPTVVATVPCGLRDLTGRELFEAQQLAAQVTTEVLIRHRTDVTTEMRMVVTTTAGQSRTLAILAVLDPDGVGRELRLLCRDIV